MPARAKIPDLFGRATAILGEHSRLRETVARLERLCTETAERSEAAELELQRSVADFSEQLSAHFDAEDSRGYFGMVESDAPELGQTIARLRAEHRMMLTELDEIREAMSDGVGRRAELLGRLAALLAGLRAHEQAENMLIAEYFEHEDGAGGS